MHVALQLLDRALHGARASVNAEPKRGVTRVESCWRCLVEPLHPLLLAPQPLDLTLVLDPTVVAGLLVLAAVLDDREQAITFWIDGGDGSDAMNATEIAQAFADKSESLAATAARSISAVPAASAMRMSQTVPSLIWIYVPRR
jgi:hypothetical protein